MDANWRDGFLFIGNQLSLDFLNTCPLIDGKAQELLPDPAALARWLMAAGFRVRRDRGTSWTPEDNVSLQRILQLRETLRINILTMETGQGPTRAFLRYCNELLYGHPFTDEVVRLETGMFRRRLYTLATAADALVPILDAVAELLTLPDPSRIRKCDNCVLHFLDTSKKGTRRWCSMQLCGNRAKVAAYLKRKNE